MGREAVIRTRSRCHSLPPQTCLCSDPTQGLERSREFGTVAKDLVREGPPQAVALARKSDVRPEFAAGGITRLQSGLKYPHNGPGFKRTHTDAYGSKRTGVVALLSI